MDFYIQMGHGMQQICIELSEHRGGATVILSPIKFAPDKIAPFSRSLKKTKNHQVGCIMHGTGVKSAFHS